MRVAIVCTELSPFVGGGIAASVRATAQVLAGAGHHVDLFTRRSFRARASRLTHESPAFRHPRIQWHWVEEPANDASDWHVQMSSRFDHALRDAYAAAQPDLVEIHDYQGLGAHIAAERGGGRLADTTVAVRLHSSLEQVGFLDATPSDPQINVLERVSLAASDVMLAPSEAVFDFYRDFYRNLELPPAMVVPPGFLYDDAPSLLPAREPSDSLELLLVGRQQRFKGTDRLVRALVAAPELPIRLTLLGGDTQSGPTGSMRDYVRHLAADDARITIAGPVPRREIAGYLQRCDALVVSSTWETWGNVGLEALAAARPLIVTPCASLPDMAGGGRFGIVADGHDESDLLRALERAVDERDRLRALAGDPALPAHLRELVDERAIATGYAAVSALGSRGALSTFNTWLTDVQAARRAPVRAATVTSSPSVTAELQETFSEIYAQENVDGRAARDAKIRSRLPPRALIDRHRLPP